MAKKVGIKKKMNKAQAWKDKASNKRLDGYG